MPESDKAVVLITDGEASVVKNVTSTLEKAGFTVLKADGGPAVLDLCARHRDPIQLAIMDMAMAGNAPELVDRLYGSYPGIRILFTSTQDESAAVPPIGRGGRVRMYLRKPFRRSQLLGRVLQAMDSPMVTTA